MHPCCNGSLQTGTKVIAIFELVLSILCCAGGTFGLYFALELSSHEGDLNYDQERNNKNLIAPSEIESIHQHEEKLAKIGAKLMFLSIISLVVGVANLLMSLLLLVGANKKNRAMCMVWFVFQIFCLVLIVIEIALREHVPEERLSVTFFITDTLSILLNLYFLWVVWAFMKQLKETSTAVSPYAHLKPRV